MKKECLEVFDETRSEEYYGFVGRVVLWILIVFLRVGGGFVLFWEEILLFWVWNRASINFFEVKEFLGREVR